jgi:hypothetical protein
VEASGRDEKWERVSRDMESSVLPGLSQVLVAPNSTVDFTIRLSWAENVSTFTIYSEKSSRMLP